MLVGNPTNFIYRVWLMSLVLGWQDIIDIGDAVPARALDADLL